MIHLPLLLALHRRRDYPGRIARHQMNHRLDPQAWLIGICAVFLVSVFLFFSGWILISVLGGDSDPDETRIETVYFRDDGSAYIKECHETSGGFYAGKVFVPTNRTECKEIEVEFTKP